MREVFYPAFLELCYLHLAEIKLPFSYPGQEGFRIYTLSVSKPIQGNSEWTLKRKAKLGHLALTVTLQSWTHCILYP